MKSIMVNNLIVFLILTVGYITPAHAVSDAELGALEKQIEQIELEEKKQAKAAEKKKIEAEAKREIEAKNKKKEKRMTETSQRLKAKYPKGKWIFLEEIDCSIWNQWGETAMLTHTFSRFSCVDGMLSGMVIYNEFVNGERTGTYEGEFKDGIYHGHGVMTSANGDRYEGEFKDGAQHGRGVQTWAKGDRYEGEFKDGPQNGRGVYTWANGDRYEGEFKDSKMHGRGVHTWADGNRREGEFKNGEVVQWY